MRVDDQQQHPLLVDFEQLSAEDKRRNYDPAIVTLAMLAELGYLVRRHRRPAVSDVARVRL